MTAILAMPGIIEALIAVIGTLIGALVGFMLSEWGTSRREKRNELKVAQSCRTIISLEIDLNLELLQDVWPKVITPIPGIMSIDEQSKQELLRIAFAKKFIEVPFPELSREVFAAQLPSITNALNSQEMVRVFQFYDRLRKIETIRKELTLEMEAQRIEDREEKARRVASAGKITLAYAAQSPFDEKAITFWNECESLVAQLFAKGNPLKTQKSN